MLGPPPTSLEEEEEAAIAPRVPGPTLVARADEPD